MLDKVYTISISASYSWGVRYLEWTKYIQDYLDTTYQSKTLRH